MKMQRKTSEAGRRDRRSIMPKRGAVLQRMKKSRHAINQRTPDTQVRRREDVERDRAKWRATCETRKGGA